MCWKDEDEKYNDGQAFKLTCRTDAGVIVTLIADNYFGYCKKEVKTQISYAANLYGNVEEEHAGGAIAFPSYSFGDEYQTDSRKVNGRTFDDVVRDYGRLHGRSKPEGYGIDKAVPRPDLHPRRRPRQRRPRRKSGGPRDGKEHAIPLLPGKVYMTPSGFKVRMEKHPGAPSWRIIGTGGEGTFCHKPCTVSGGGKSEISKTLRDYMLYGPIFVADLEKDFELVERDLRRRITPTAGSPTRRARPTTPSGRAAPILSPRAVAGQRDQAADAVAGIHRRVQRLARVDPELHLPDRLHHQALLPARSGTATGASTSAWTSSTASPATS